MMNRKNFQKKILKDSSKKEHYRQYKKGKSWMYATLTTVAGVLGAGALVPQIVAHADTTTAQQLTANTLATQSGATIPAAPTSGSISTVTSTTTSETTSTSISTSDSTSGSTSTSESTSTSASTSTSLSLSHSLSDSLSLSNALSESLLNNVPNQTGGNSNPVSTIPASSATSAATVQTTAVALTAASTTSENSTVTIQTTSVNLTAASVTPSTSGTTALSNSTSNTLAASTQESTPASLSLSTSTSRSTSANPTTVQPKALATTATATSTAGSWGSVIWTIDTTGNLVLNPLKAPNETMGATGDTTTNPMAIYKTSITTIDIKGPIIASSASSLNNLFSGLANVTSITGLGNISLPNGTAYDATSMFGGNSRLTSLDTASFNTSNITNMTSMFNNVGIFNQATTPLSLDLSTWDVSHVTSMQDMFANMVVSYDGPFAPTPVSINVSNWNTTNVTNMSEMFHDANISSLNLSSWHISSITNTTNMFTVFRLSSLTLGLGTALNADMQLSTPQILGHATRWQNIGAGTASAPIGNHVWSSAQLVSTYNPATDADTYVLQPVVTAGTWGTTPWTLDTAGNLVIGQAGLTTTMGANDNTLAANDPMLVDTPNIKTITLKGTVSADSTNSLNNLFANLPNVTAITGLGNIVLPGGPGYDASQMFSNDISLASLDTATFNTSNIINMTNMFYSVSGQAANQLSLDLSHWDVRHVTNMTSMFSMAGKTVVSDISILNTSPISINLANWQLSSTTDTTDMLDGAISSLTLGSGISLNSNMHLPEIFYPYLNLSLYTGYWQNVGSGTPSDPAGSNVWTSAQLIANYNPAKDADTYVWQPTNTIGSLAIFPVPVNGYYNGDMTVTTTGAEQYNSASFKTITGNDGQNYLVTVYAASYPATATATTADGSVIAINGIYHAVDNTKAPILQVSINGGAEEDFATAVSQLAGVGITLGEGFHNVGSSDTLIAQYGLYICAPGVTSLTPTDSIDSGLYGGTYTTFVPSTTGSYTVTHPNGQTETGDVEMALAAPTGTQTVIGLEYGTVTGAVSTSVKIPNGLPSGTWSFTDATTGDLIQVTNPADAIGLASYVDTVTGAKGTMSLTVNQDPSTKTYSITYTASPTLSSGTYGTIPWTLDAAGNLVFGSGSVEEGVSPQTPSPSPYTIQNLASDLQSNGVTPSAVKTINFQGSATISVPFVTDVDPLWYIFGDLPSLTTVSGLSNVSYSGVAIGLFANDPSLTSIDLSGFDTSHITNMSGMFSGDTALTSLDLSGFNTSNTLSMSGMFAGDSALGSLDLSTFNTSKVVDMSSMFQGDSSLSTLDLSNFDTSNVYNFASMFAEDSGLTSLNVSHFNTSNVGHWTNAVFQMIVPTQVMANMFSGDSMLKTLDISSFTIPQSITIGAPDVGPTVFLSAYAAGMFSGMTNLDALTLGPNEYLDPAMALPEPTNWQDGLWQNVASGTWAQPTGTNVWTSTQLLASYNPATDADTYVVQHSWLGSDNGSTSASMSESMSTSNSVSTSGSLSASRSSSELNSNSVTSNSLSMSDSLSALSSTSNSISQSNSTLGSLSLSNSVSALTSTSLSTSGSISASESLSISNSGSEAKSSSRSDSKSASKSLSLSHSNSRSKNSSLSTNISNSLSLSHSKASIASSVSRSLSHSVSASMSSSKSNSRSEAQSLRLSNSASKSKNSSLSTSTSNSLSLSHSKASTTGSASRSLSHSVSTSKSSSRSNFKSTSKSLSLSKSASKSNTASTSKSLSLSNSRSASKSQSRSTAKSLSLSHSISISASNSISISLSSSTNALAASSLSVSDSISTSTSSSLTKISTSSSLSNSTSLSNAGSTSSSFSDSTSLSSSSSTSSSLSNTLSGSTSVSSSLSLSDSASSNSTSTSLSLSDSLSSSTSVSSSASLSFSGSTSASTSSSLSYSESTSNTLSTSTSLSLSTSSSASLSDSTSTSSSTSLSLSSSTSTSTSGSLSTSTSLSNANQTQTLYVANTTGFATSQNLTLTAQGDNYTGSFTDAYGDKITISIPSGSGQDGTYTVTYPDGSVAQGTIPAADTTTSTTTSGNTTTVAYNVDLLAASVSGKYTTTRPVPELETTTAGGMEDISYSFTDAKTGDLVNVTGTVDPAAGTANLTYTDTTTGQSGSVTYLQHANGTDYYYVTSPTVNPTPTPSSPSTPATSNPSTPSTSSPVTSNPATSGGNGSSALPSTGDATVATLETVGAALIGGAMTLSVLKRKKKSR